MHNRRPCLASRLVYFLFLWAMVAVCSVRLARGQSFKLASSPPIVNGLIWMFAQDINGDGKADFVTVNFSTPGTLLVVTNNGDGSGNFTDGVLVTVGSNPQCAVAADVNGDQRVDLITANEGTNTVSVVTNRGSGLFGTATNFTVGHGPRSVVAGDFGRGVVDLVSANYDDSSLTLLTNNGAGVFGSNALYTLTGSPQSIISGDVNGDGKLDLIVAVQNYIGVTVLTNKGNGTFALSSTNDLGSVFPFQLAAVDVNGDHKLDVIVADDTYYRVFVLINDGTGQFTVEPYLQTRDGLLSFAVVDANNDGVPDIITGSYATNSLQVYTNNGAGVFSAAEEIAALHKPTFLASADVNQDSRLDVIASHFENVASILTNAFVVVPPMLRIRNTSTNYSVLNWPLYGTNFLLQQNTNLASTNWVTVPNGVDISTGTNQVVLPRQTGSLFYRLMK